MILHYPTIVAAGGIIVTICAVTFILNVVLRHNDHAGRLWMVAFISVLLMNISVLAVEVNPYVWWAIPVSNGMLVLTLGFIWSGLRVVNGRRPFIAVPAAAGAVATVAALAEGPRGGDWAGAGVLFAIVAVTAGLSAFECLRGRLASRVNARILAVALGAGSVYYAARLVAFLVSGPDAAEFLLFAPSVVSIVLTSLLVVGTLTLSALHSDLRTKGGGLDSTGVEEGTGMVGPADFQLLTEAWLARAERDRSVLAFATFTVPNLQELTVAFGRDARLSALANVGRIVAERMPAATILGGLSTSVIAALFVPPADRDVDSLLSQIEADVIRYAVDEDERFRVSVVTAHTLTRSGGATFDDLLDGVEGRVPPRS